MFCICLPGRVVCFGIWTHTLSHGSSTNKGDTLSIFGSPLLQDERDIFGDVSDDDPEKAEQIALVDPGWSFSLVEIPSGYDIHRHSHGKIHPCYENS